MYTRYTHAIYFNSCFFSILLIPKWKRSIGLYINTMQLKCALSVFLTTFQKFFKRANVNNFHMLGNILVILGLPVFIMAHTPSSPFVQYTDIPDLHLQCSKRQGQSSPVAFQAINHTRWFAHARPPPRRGLTFMLLKSPGFLVANAIFRAFVCRL